MLRPERVGVRGLGPQRCGPVTKRVPPLPYGNQPLLFQHYHVVVRVALYSRLLVYVYTSAAASTSSSRTITSSCVCIHERCDWLRQLLLWRLRKAGVAWRSVFTRVREESAKGISGTHLGVASLVQVRMNAGGIPRPFQLSVGGEAVTYGV